MQSHHVICRVKTQFTQNKNWKISSRWRTEIRSTVVPKIHDRKIPYYLKFQMKTVADILDQLQMRSHDQKIPQRFHKKANQNQTVFQRFADGFKIFILSCSNFLMLLGWISNNSKIHRLLSLKWNLKISLYLICIWSTKTYNAIKQWFKNKQKWELGIHSSPHIFH